MATFALMAWQGPVNETTVPYSSAASVYAADSLSNSLIRKAALRVTDVYYVDPTEDRAAVKALLVKNGSIDFGYYSDAAYYSSTYNSFYTPSCSEYANHAISIVGWDDNFSKENFLYTAPADGAWYVRNSWTTNSDQSYYAYFWMSYYDASIDNMAASYKATSVDTYDNNYQYDGNVMAAWETGVTKAANVFTVKASRNGETLKAVSFFTADAGVKYTIRIYKDPGTNNPESGTLISSATTKGSRTYSGYHTITLANPVKLTYGTKFAVVITLSTEYSSEASIGCEYNYSMDGPEGNINLNAVASSGQSFIKDGSTWIDYGAEYNGNLRIKAYTVNNEASPYTDNLYNIRFYANGGTGKMASMKDLKYPESYELTPNGFTRANRIFTGWNTKKDGSGKSYKNKASVSELTTINGGTVKLYAQWTSKCKITYVLNGGKNNSKNVASFRIKSRGSVKLYKPTRSGYTFAGWYTTKSFKSGTKVTSLPKSTTSNYKVYAKWVPAGQGASEESGNN